MLLRMEWREKQLLEAVKRLAAPPEEQVAHLRGLGSFPSLDELALEFDDVFGPPEVRRLPGNGPMHSNAWRRC